MRVYFRKVTPGGGESHEQLGAVIKNCLKKVVGKAKLSFEELNTVIVEIEKCINSRPSTYLSEKHEDTVITPNHHGRDIDRKDGKHIAKLHLKELRFFFFFFFFFAFCACCHVFWFFVFLYLWFLDFLFYALG